MAERRKKQNSIDSNKDLLMHIEKNLSERLLRQDKDLDNLKSEAFKIIKDLKSEAFKLIDDLKRDSSNKRLHIEDDLKSKIAYIENQLHSRIDVVEKKFDSRLEAFDVSIRGDYRTTGINDKLDHMKWVITGLIIVFTLIIGGKYAGIGLEEVFKYMKNTPAIKEVEHKNSNDTKRSIIIPKKRD